MACECAANCKANVSAKQTGYLTLINSLASSGVTSDMSKMFTYLLDDVNRLRNIYKRLEEIQALITSEEALPVQGYISDSVRYGLLQELIAIKAVSESDYNTLSTILGIQAPEEIPGA